MKTNRKNQYQIKRITNKRPINILRPIIIVPVMIIILSLIGGYLVWRQQFEQAEVNQENNTEETVIPETKIDLSPPTEEQVEIGQDIKEHVNEKTQSTIFSITITSAGIHGDLLQIRAVVNGAISNDGVCDLTLTGPSGTIEKTAKTYALASYSTCQGFDINRAELSPGSWTIDLTVIIDGETATAKSEVIIE